VPVEVTPTGIVAGLREAASRHQELVELAPKARRLQERRWQSQLRALRQILAEDSSRVTSAPQEALSDA
jgi:hypothetical protein